MRVFALTRRCYPHGYEHSALKCDDAGMCWTVVGYKYDMGLLQSLADKIAELRVEAALTQPVQLLTIFET